ncbi:MAG: Ig-like domain-containing domain [Limisphaerales bacterium]
MKNLVTRFVSFLAVAMTGWSADVASFGVVKGQLFTLVEVPGIPAMLIPTGGALEAFVNANAADAVSAATITAPNDSDNPLSLDSQTPARLWYREESPDVGELNSLFPAGDYVFGFETTGGSAAATLTVPAPAYPPALTLQNTAALGAINPSAPLTLSWAPIPGGTANDYVEVVIEGTAEEDFRSPGFGAAGALDGTATSMVVPANALAPNSPLFIALKFLKVSNRNTTALPDATGITGFFSEVKTIGQTTAGGGGPTDTTPPTFLAVQPANGATRVPVNQAVTFTFSEAMQTIQAIEWSANVAANPVSYLWSLDTTTLTCRFANHFPTNTVITWKLNPAGAATPFKDVAGNALAADLHSGSFATSPVDCTIDEGEDEDFGSFAWSKFTAHLQTSDAAPVPHPETLPMFNAFVSSPTNNPVTAASMKVPGGGSVTLTNFFFSKDFFFIEEHATEEAMDLARPLGAYEGVITRTSGGNFSSVLTIPANPYPPIPHVLNWTAAQTVDPHQDFTLTWNGFPNATTNDFITLSLHEQDGGFSLTAPDPCFPLILTAADKSLVIPKDTLAPNKTYEGSLTFSRAFSQHLPTPDFYSQATIIRDLEFILKTGTAGTTPTAPKFISQRVLEDGKFELQFEVKAPLNYVLERATSMPGTSWTTVLTHQAAVNGTVIYSEAQTAGLAGAYFRVRLQQ